MQDLDSRYKAAEQDTKARKNYGLDENFVERYDRALA